MTIRNDSGHAILETFVLGLVLVAPLLWSFGVLAHIHKGALGTTAAARAAGFDAAGSVDARVAERAIDRAVRTALADHGLAPDRARVRWTAARGLERGATIEIEVSYPVPVAAAPFLGAVSGPSIWVRARHVARIDPYRSRP